MTQSSGSQTSACSRITPRPVTTQIAGFRVSESVRLGWAQESEFPTSSWVMLMLLCGDRALRSVSVMHENAVEPSASNFYIRLGCTKEGE